MQAKRFYTLSGSCPDQIGIIARVSGFIAQHRGWILESSYHADDGSGENDSRYFMRMEVKADSLPFHLAEFRERFRPLAEDSVDELEDQRFGGEAPRRDHGQQTGALPL
jgi:formyltetrahydrofolate deformylase